MNRTVAALYVDAGRYFRPEGVSSVDGVTLYREVWEKIGGRQVSRMSPLSPERAEELLLGGEPVFRLREVPRPNTYKGGRL